MSFLCPAWAPSAIPTSCDSDTGTQSMVDLNQTTFTHIFCGNYATANAQLDEVAALAEKNGPYIGRRSGLRSKVACWL